MENNIKQPTVLEPPGKTTVHPGIGTPESDIADKISNAFARYWNVIVWNDDVHTFEYVIISLMQVVGCTQEEGLQHASTIHEKGKSCVASETQEKAELYYEQLISLKLSVTLERNS